MLISSCAFAAQNALAVYSYESGATPLTLVTIRVIFTLGALWVLMKIAGLSVPLPKRERNAALGIGLLNAFMAFSLMSSIEHIPIGLAILVFYLYPVFTGLGAWVTGQEKLNIGLVVGLGGGFIGLALALDVTGAIPNTLGIGLAALASVLMAGVVLISARILKTNNSRSVVLHMHLSGAILFTLMSAFWGSIDLPQTSIGWMGFVGVLIFYTIAVASFFAGIAYIGAVRASLVMNLEPIASIVLGFALLSQVLTLQQLLGALIVIAAVTAVKWLSGKKTEN